MTPDLGADAPCLLSGIDNHRDLHAPTDRRPDLSTRATIHDLVIRFYREIVFDDLLAPVFDEVAEADWTIHIPNLIDYWCWIVLGTNRYHGSVTATHRRLHSLQELEPAQCDRWYQLWCSTIDDSWTGPCAEKARTHAAALMAGMAKHVFGFNGHPPAAPDLQSGLAAPSVLTAATPLPGGQVRPERVESGTQPGELLEVDASERRHPILPGVGEP